LSIPKLNFSAVVVEGTSRRQLLLGPGHMPKSAAPGEPGNSVITGHRDTFFRHIADLDKGDQILVQRSGSSYTYEVSYKKIVKPTDLWVTEPSSDARLTLVTCYPIYYIGPAPERLIVVAKLVPAAPAQIASAGAAVPASAKGFARRLRKQ
jgi:sortase A